MSSIHIGNVSNKERMLYKAMSNTVSFGRLFLPDDFGRSATPAFHYHMAEAMDYAIRDQLLMVLPRGHGKTVLTKAYILKTFLRKGIFDKNIDFHFFIWLAATQSQSFLNLDYIKGHLEENERIIYYFGKQRPQRGTWNKEDIELKNGCKLMTRSNVSGIRGMAKKHMRPTRIIADDFEDENNTKTETSRAQIRNVITAVLKPALDPDVGILQLNGTPVHFDAFIVRLLDKYNKHRKDGTLDKFAWDVVTYKTTIDNPLWPSYQGEQKLRAKKQFYIDSQMPAKWYQEYEMLIQSPDDMAFTERHLRYWDGHVEMRGNQPFLIVTHIDGQRTDGMELPVNIFTGTDSATEVESMEIDYTVIIAAAIDEHNNTYVLGYTRKRNMPIRTPVFEDYESKPGIVDTLYEYHKMYQPKMHSIEDVGISKGIFPSLKQFMREKNDFTMNIRRGKHGGRNKLDRIYAIISGRFANRTVFIKETHSEFVSELLTFGPRMANDDILDAFAYCIERAYPPKNITPQNEVRNKITPFPYEKQLPQPKNSWITV